MKRATVFLAVLTALVMWATHAQAERFGVRGPNPGARFGVRGPVTHPGHSRVAFSLRFGTGVRRTNGHSYHRPYRRPYRYTPYHHRTYRPYRRPVYRPVVVTPPVVFTSPVVVAPPQVRYLLQAPCGHTSVCECTQYSDTGYWLYLQVRDPDGVFRFRWVWALR